MKTHLNLTENKELQSTLNGLFNHASLISSGIPDYQAKHIALDGNFQELKANRSQCCFADIDNGYCSFCGIECTNLL